MKFIETPIFTKQVQALLADEEYKSLQIALMLRPEQGYIMQGSGGLRKIRWAMKGCGKLGGLRVIYFWDNTTDSFYMLYLYAKNKQEDLTADQVKILCRLVMEEFS